MPRYRLDEEVCRLRSVNRVEDLRASALSILRSLSLVGPSSPSQGLLPEDPKHPPSATQALMISQSILIFNWSQLKSTFFNWFTGQTMTTTTWMMMARIVVVVDLSWFKSWKEKIYLRLQKGVDMLFLQFIRPKQFNTTASLHRSVSTASGMCVLQYLISALHPNVLLFSF